MSRLRETARVWLDLGLRHPANGVAMLVAAVAGGVAAVDRRALLALVVLAVVVLARPGWFRRPPQDPTTWVHPADVPVRVVMVTRFEDVDGVPCLVTSSHDGRHIHSLEDQRG